MKQWITGILVCVFATFNASAAIINNTFNDHSTQVTTAAGELATSLGTSVTSFSGGSVAGWSTMAGSLSSDDVLLTAQNGGTSNISASALTDISDFVFGGGTLLSLWGEDNSFTTGGSSPFTLLNAVTGESLTWEFGGSTGTPGIDKTANATGTTFATGPASLTAASNHGGVQLGSLGGGISMYETASLSHIVMFEVGLGKVGFLSWDWCCGDGAGVRDEWDSMLLAAATYETSAVPEPSIIALFAAGLFGLGFARRRKA